MSKLEYTIQMEVAGNTAIWTRPDSGDSPVSYPAPTYSAVKALFESVLWGPAVEIIPRKVELCAPIRYHSYATNYGGPLRSPSNIKGDNNYQLYATVLIDVCYRIYAVAVPNKNKRNISQNALRWDKNTSSPGHAYQEIFNRRLKNGQCFANLCMGWKEFTPSYFGPFRNDTKVFEEMEDILIPSMLRQSFSDGYNSQFHAVFDRNVVIHKGTMIFPERGYVYDK